MNSQVFEDIKVVELCWAGVGPIICSYLAYFGAEVIKVESESRPDPTRTMPPFKDNIPGINRSGFYGNLNSNKLICSLNLKNSKSKDILKPLIRRCDIVVESFTPGVLERLGFSYEEVKKLKRDVIMLRTCMLGHSGSEMNRPGYGAILSGLCGFPLLTGYPDTEVAGTATSYTDFVAPQFALASLLMALDIRSKTGQGRYIDQSQFESSVHFMEPVILDYTVNKRVRSRDGNRSSYAAPHGIYPCQGADRWVAIAVFSDEEWLALCSVMGRPGLAEDEKFATLDLRIRSEDELDRCIEMWTKNHTAEEITELLQRVSIASGPVADGKDIHKDPQLKHREHFKVLDHPERGKCTFDSPPIILSRTPGGMRMPDPCASQHTEYVCTKILGMPDDEFLNFLSQGVFE